jgi:hypothetical protein
MAVIAVSPRCVLVDHVPEHLCAHMREKMRRILAQNGTAIQKSARMRKFESFTRRDSPYRRSLSATGDGR